MLGKLFEVYANGYFFSVNTRCSPHKKRRNGTIVINPQERGIPRVRSF